MPSLNDYYYAYADGKITSLPASLFITPCAECHREYDFARHEKCPNCQAENQGVRQLLSQAINELFVQREVRQLIALSSDKNLRRLIN